MGILNVTPDSFSDGGKFVSIEKAIQHAFQMEKEGADIIDVGGESTRPGASPVTAEEEMRRVLPVLEQLVGKLRIPISIDTYKSKVAEKALEVGASMINDVSALRGDTELLNVARNYDVPICLMHMKGAPRNMQVNPVYQDVMGEIIDFMKERIDYATSHGVKKENIIVDPGIGFGKRTGKGVEDNCEILRRLPELKKLGFPILVGASRKTFVGNVCGKNKPLPVVDRLEGSLAAACVSVMNGADIIRVHDVKETRRCVDLVDCVVR
ncbi:MAG: dihydropteroate synthase [Thermoplasmata archaeon]|nr:dihydropteroate synthase [Thermoplasmata archaeon]